MFPQYCLDLFGGGFVQVLEARSVCCYIIIVAGPSVDRVAEQIILKIGRQVIGKNFTRT